MTHYSSTMCWHHSVQPLSTFGIMVTNEAQAENDLFGDLGAMKGSFSIPSPFFTSLLFVLYF